MGRTEDRLRVLEAHIRRLGELADQAPERLPDRRRVRNPRLAATEAQEGVAYPSAPCTVYPVIFLDSTYTQTAGDQTPTHTDRQAYPEALAYYDGGDYLAQGTLVIVLWDNDRWWIIRGGAAGAILWGVVQAGFTNGAGSTSWPVYIKSCDYLGGQVSGDVFYAFTPGLGAVVRCTKDTALFTGYVVGYQNQLNAAGQLIQVIVTDIWDDPIGSLRMVTGDTAIPDGWTEYTASRDRFVLGKAAPGGTTYGQTGGMGWTLPAHSLLHGGACGYSHGSHPTATRENGSGIAIYPFQDNTDPSRGHIDVDTTPPFIVVKLIERTS